MNKGKKNLTIDDLAVMMAKGFTRADKRMDEGLARADKKVDDLAAMVAKGFSEIDKRFEQVDKRFDRVEKDIVWLKDISEKNATVLKHLDEKMVFSTHRSDLLEIEIEKIKAS